MSSRRPLHYKLVGRLAVPVRTDLETPEGRRGLREWAGSLRPENKRVAEDDIGGVWISTVFLGLDHNFVGEGDPLLFETMVFGDTEELVDIEMERYSTWDEAEKGHAAIVARIRAQVEALNRAMNRVMGTPADSVVGGDDA